MKINRRLAGALLGAAALAVTLVGCSSGPATPPMPATTVVSYMGTNYCGYRYSPYEIDMYHQSVTCTRIAFPSISTVPTVGTIQWVLANQYATYADWYDSGWYYDTYLAPIPTVYHTTIVVNRGTFISNATISHRTYSTLIKNDAPKARYTGKGGRTVSKYTFPTSNPKATKATSGTNKTSGGNAGSSSLFSGSGTTSKPKPAAPAKPAGKPGRR